MKLTERIRILQALRSGPRSMRGTLIFLLKIVVAASLMALALWNVDFRGQFASWASLNLWHLAFAGFAIMFGQFVSAVRWIIVLKRWGVPLKLGEAFRLNLVGLFFNLAFPSSIGGDVTRIFFVTRHTGRGTESVMSVLLTRVIGVVVLLLMGFASAVVFASSVLPAWASMLAAGTGIVGVLVAILAVRSDFAGRWVEGPKSGAVGKLRQAVSAMRTLGQDVRAMVEITVLSFLVQIISIHGFYEAARAVGVETSYINFLVFMPIIIVATMVPISLFGLGVRENAFVFLFGMVGISEALSVSMSLTWFLAYLGVSVICGLVLLTLEESFFVGRNGDVPEAVQDPGIPPDTAIG